MIVITVVATHRTSCHDHFLVKLLFRAQRVAAHALQLGATAELVRSLVQPFVKVAGFGLLLQLDGSAVGGGAAEQVTGRSHDSVLGTVKARYGAVLSRNEQFHNLFLVGFGRGVNRQAGLSTKGTSGVLEQPFWRMKQDEIEENSGQ